MTAGRSYMRWQLLQHSLAALAATTLLAACEPAVDTGLQMVTIETAESGLSLRELPPKTLRSIGLPFGLAVIRADGNAARVGLKVGDVIYGVNQQKAASLQEFNRQLSSATRIGLLVRRGTTDFYVDLARSPGEGMPGRPPRSRETPLRT